MNARAAHFVQTEAEKIEAKRVRFFLRKHDKRCLRLKILITSTFALGLAIDSMLSVHIAFFGNVLWLWVDFE